MNPDAESTVAPSRDRSGALPAARPHHSGYRISGNAPLSSRRRRMLRRGALLAAWIGWLAVVALAHATRERPVGWLPFEAVVVGAVLGLATVSLVPRIRRGRSGLTGTAVMLATCLWLVALVTFRLTYGWDVSASVLPMPDVPTPVVGVVLRAIRLSVLGLVLLVIGDVWWESMVHDTAPAPPVPAWRGLLEVLLFMTVFLAASLFPLAVGDAAGSLSGRAVRTLLAGVGTAGGEVDASEAAAPYLAGRRSGTDRADAVDSGGASAAERRWAAGVLAVLGDAPDFDSIARGWWKAEDDPGVRARLAQDWARAGVADVPIGEHAALVAEEDAWRDERYD